MSTAEKRPITVALAGNANVGKSVIFNYFTGLHQHIGNWPGKTVEKAEGTLHFKGHVIDVIDLPGIYSLSAFSIEERISREYIAIQRPDIVINIVDASVLERNLFFTIQLLELETPMIMALNQMDLAKGKGITINIPQLQKSLGIPIIPTIATRGAGLGKLLDKAVKIAKGMKVKSTNMRYGREIEEKISKVTKLVEKIPIEYPPRWVAIKLLEGDEEIRKIVGRIDQKIVSSAERHARDLERIHGEPCSTIITSERYNVANKIARGNQRIMPPRGPSLTERLDAVITHPVMGYPILIGIMLLILFTVFTVGGYLSGFFEDVMGPIRGAFGGEIGELIGEGVFGGLIAGIAIVLPFILPFYLILTLLEDSGYLPRAAFMTDSLMHRVGIHGKAFIPFILGYGCNVPACLGCRIMETERERTIATFVVTLVPCAAVTVVVLGLVGAFVGIHWNTLSPVTVGWLGLPAITGVLLIFGILRKELTLVMLATLMGTANFATVLTPTQMIVFAIVVMYYIPCIATIAALVKELGWKKAAYITVFEIAFALLIGGIAFKLLTLA